MAMASINPSTVATLLFLALLLPTFQTTEAQIGVCYGGSGNNLPSKQDVVNLYKSNNIGSIRIYDPDQGILNALKGSNINVILGVPNDKLQSIASDPSQATQWVQSNVVPFASSVGFRYIAVGNEIHPSDATASSVVPAMTNVLNALNSANLGGQIKVTTAIDTTLLSTNSFPPSKGAFADTSYVTPIINFLTANGSPLLVNVYPYFSYVNNKGSIDLSYALFTSSGTVVTDSGNGLQYQNLFDALVDTVYAALAKVGAGNMAIVVSESGWPSAGGDSATLDNAGTYYKNLAGHVKQGTPLKKQGIETYLFEMFDENGKQGAATEQHFGVFSPNQQPKYQLSFN